LATLRAACSTATRLASVGARRSAHADEDDVRAGDGLGCIGGEAEPARLELTDEQLLHTRLEEGGFARLAALDLAGVGIVADDVVTERGHGDTGDEPDVARSDDAYTHTNRLPTCRPPDPESPPLRVFHAPCTGLAL